MKQNNDLSILRARLDEGGQSARALAVQALSQIRKDTFFSVLPVEDATVQQMADYAQERIRQDSSRDLTGIPVAVGQMLCMKDVNARYDATIVRKLKGYGAIIAAQAESPCLAVSRGIVRVAFGARLLSDAPKCRVYALMPSFGMVSRYGALGAPSLTQVGVAARTPRECAIGMDAISDYDPYDPAMLRPNCYQYAEKIGQSIRGLRIGTTDGATARSLRVSQTITLVSLGWAEALREYVHRAESAIAGNGELPTSADYENMRAARGQLNREIEGALGLLDALLLPNNPATVAALELCGLGAVATPNDLLIVPKRYQETVALQIAETLRMEELL